ncbi:hypothetical protein OH76DRAFT_1455825 [Lentinus brumalis]|uniref:Uncharacterized protein n=1 Tax=Lentinus brumalis TaxID=2498619 RepID=A0A371DAM5_9APHY|nr:hypothetical protein OH76DRAFT_1455825 [Polyporus brumalis]
MPSRATAPQVCDYRDAKVASRDIFDTMVITSPNMDYVPAYPVETTIVHTYADGMWGQHEYSRFPQPFVRGRWHLACIPARPCPPDVPAALWNRLSAKDWREDTSIGFSGLGHMTAELQEDLDHAAAVAIRRYEEYDVPDNVRAYGNMLVLILRQVLDRMRHLPAAPSVAIAVAAHVQRVALELCGLRTYAEVLVPRTESSVDFSARVLPVVGGFAREASDAALFTRVGVPTWYLQPLTHQLGVWRVVESQPWFASVSREEMNPPIYQSLASMVGVGNLTGNWQQSMLLAVSKQVAGSHLAALAFAEVPEVPREESPMKRPRLEDDGEGLHLLMRSSTSAPVAHDPKKSRRRRKRGKGQPPTPDSPEAAVGTSASSALPLHPSKSYIPSAWFDDYSVWEKALKAVSPVARPRASALYFYPPPFLLDAVSSIAPLDPSAPYPARARTDEKIHRYLHNFARIRRFLCIRLFDPSLSHEPLTIAEWRAALWGDYLIRDYTFLPKPKGSPSDVKRIQRLQKERNEVRRFFSRVAQLRSYREDEPVLWQGAPLPLDGVRDLLLRASVLWECHEINFRAELMALDTLLVHKSTWQEVHRWEREAVVSAVWGPPSTVLSVLPAHNADSELRWACKFVADVPHTEAVRTLRNFAKVLMRWPGCPEQVVGVANGGSLSYSDFMQSQAQAVDFYVRQFVEHYSRLPVPPIAFPLVLK